MHGRDKGDFAMKLRRICSEISKEKARMIAAALLILGCAVRLLFPEALPLGLNQDEASSGYDAWALLRTGMDRNGNSWPVLFVSWGRGQNVLMSYLSMPFIALLGLRPLSVRLPNALAGCLSLAVMWRLARRARGERFGLCVLFLLAVNPWHIMSSRWALESNLLPALILGACYFLFRAEKNQALFMGRRRASGLRLMLMALLFFCCHPFWFCPSSSFGAPCGSGQPLPHWGCFY